MEGQKRFSVTLKKNGYPYKSDEPFVEALRQIIQTQYQHLYEKYGYHFDWSEAKESECVKIAQKVLCDYGYVVTICAWPNGDDDF